MAIEKVGLYIDSNAEEVLKQLTRIDNAVKSVSKSKSKVNIDSSSIDSATRSAEDLADGVDKVSDSAEDADKKVTRSFSSIGQSISSIGSSLSSAGNSFDSLGSSILSALNPFDGFTSSILGSLSAYALLSAAIDQVTDSLDAAISRFSTLERFPRVLSALGFDSAEIAASSQALTDYVQNTRVQLDDAVNVTKRISTITDDLDQATQATIALNNAFLANGTSTKDVTRATEQFLQMLATGDVDVRSWRTLEESLQVPLKLLAQYFGKDYARQLLTAIQDEELTFLDLTEGLIALGTGEGELVKLAQENARGLDNSLELLSNAYSVALANILGSLNEMSKAVLGMELYEIVDSFRAGIYAVSDSIVDLIDGSEDTFQKLADFVDGIKQTFINFDWRSFKEGLLEGAQGLYEGFRGFIDTLSPLLKGFRLLITAYGGGSFAKGLGKLPGTLIKFALQLKLAGKALKVAGAAFTGVGSVLQFFGNLTLAKGGIGGSGGGGSAFSLGSGVSGKIIKGAAALTGVAVAITALAASLKAVDALLPDDFLGLSKKIIALSTVTVAFGAFAVAAGEFASKNPAGAIGGIIALTALAVPIIALAYACQQIDNQITGGFLTIVKKLGTMAVVIGAFSLIVAAIGALVATGAGALIAGAGIATVLALAYSIKQIAEAVAEIDRSIPENTGKLSHKVQSLVDLIDIFPSFGNPLKTLSQLFATIDIALIAQSFKSLVKIADSVRQIADADVPRDISKKIEQLNDVFSAFTKSTLGDVITDFLTASDLRHIEQITSSYITIADRLAVLSAVESTAIREVSRSVIPAINEALSSMVRAGLADLAISAISAETTDNLNAQLDTYTSLAEKLGTLTNYSAVQISTAGRVIATINTVMREMLRGGLLDVAVSAISTETTENLDSQLSAYVSIAEALNGLTDYTNVEISTAGRVISTINDVLQEMLRGGLADVVDSLTSLITTENLESQLKAYTFAATNLSKLTEYSAVQISTSGRVLSAINDALKVMVRGNLKDVLDTFTSKVSTENLESQLSAYVTIAESLGTLGEGEFGDIITGGRRITWINQALENLHQGSGIVETLIQRIFDAAGFKGLVNQLESYKEAAVVLAEIGSQNNTNIYTGAYYVIPAINKALEALLDADKADKKDAENAAETTEFLRTQLKEYREISRLLTYFGDLDTEKVSYFSDTVVPAINSVIKALSDIVVDRDVSKNSANNAEVAENLRAQIKSLLGILTELSRFSVDSIAEAVQKAESLVEVIETLFSIDATQLTAGEAEAVAETVTALLGAIGAVKEIQDIASQINPESLMGIVRTLEEFFAGIEALSLPNSLEIQAVVVAIQNLLETLQTLEPGFYNLGFEYGANLRDGFFAINIPEGFVSEIDSALLAMGKLFPKFTNLGKLYGEKLIEAFRKEVEKMSDVISTAAEALRSYSSVFSGVGASLGQSLVSGFSTAISGLSSAVSGQIGAIQTRLNSLRIPTLTASISTTGGNGGSVPGVQYRASGGSVLQSRGTDTVPAMLTPGEFVQSRKAVQTYGTDFMRKINSLDIDGAFRSIYGGSNHHSKVGVPVRTIVNNIVNHNVTNTANITQNMTGRNQDYNVKRALSHMGAV